MKNIIIYLSIQLCFIFQLVAQNNEKGIKLSLNPKINGNIVYFTYKITNNSDNDILLNNSSIGNGNFFVLSIYKENGEEIKIKAIRYRLNYDKIFGRKSNYQNIKPGKSYTKKYKTYGFNNNQKLSLIKLKLQKGKYKAEMYYSVRKEELKRCNIKYPPQIFVGEILSKTIEFVIN